VITGQFAASRAMGVLVIVGVAEAVAVKVDVAVKLGTDVNVATGVDVEVRAGAKVGAAVGACSEFGFAVPMNVATTGTPEAMLLMRGSTKSKVGLGVTVGSD